jgi:hypothetical protein
MTVIGLVALLVIAMTMLAGELYIGGMRERRDRHRATTTPTFEWRGD